MKTTTRVFITIPEHVKKTPEIEKWKTKCEMVLQEGFNLGVPRIDIYKEVRRRK